MQNLIQIRIVAAQAHEQAIETLTMAENSTVADALAQSALATAPLAVGSIATALFGKIVKPSHLLKDGDRLELLRPLVGDPKEIRRRRVQNGQTMGKKRSE